MSAAINTWDIDAWLEFLGIDPDCDCLLAMTEHGWQAEMRIPEGVDADEYLCAMEAAWREQFGAEPVEFKAYEHPATKSRFNTKLSLLELSLVDDMADAVLLQACKALAEEIAKAPPLPLHLLHAKGPRNKWGGAKGVRK